MKIAQNYTPPPLNPLEARFLNVLLTRDWSQGFDLFGTPCSFKADPWQVPFVPACGLDLSVQGEVWRVLFSSASILFRHPAGASVADVPGLPEGLRLALFELSLAPILSSLTGFFDLDKQPAVLAENNDAPDDAVCSVPLAFCLPDETVAVSVHLPNKASAEAMLLRLEQTEPAQRPVPPLFLSVAFETGAMSLSIPEVAALKNEDILLPTAYPAAHGEICLRLGPETNVRCTVADGRATVLGVEHRLSAPAENETWRTEMSDTLPETAPQENAPLPEGAAPKEQQAAQGNNAAPTVDLNTLEVAVTFELERRLMSIAEVAALTPGYTFPLPMDANGPVTVRVNGKALATGRLVDLGGVLGVQLVSMAQGR